MGLSPLSLSPSLFLSRDAAECEDALAWDDKDSTDKRALKTGQRSLSLSNKATAQ